ncbi:MAG: hypothetical protein ACI8UO_002053 [Verrucomicrobiales bacterium]|jgi:hypothetical protein
MYSRILLFLALLPALAAFLPFQSLHGQSDIQVEPYQTLRGSVGFATTRFSKLGPQATGIVYQHEIATWHRDKRLFHSSFACGAPLLGDLNLDGLPDLFVTGGPASNKLYLQAGNLAFVDVTANRVVAGHNLWASGGVMVDIDDDGDLDIYVCYYDSPNHLYVNQLKETGRLDFIEMGAQFGLNVKDACLVPAFGDYDNDGDLDLYILTHQLHRLGSRPITPIPLVGGDGGTRPAVGGDLGRYFELEDEKTDGKWMYKEVGRSDYLLRNDNGRFVDVGESVGIPKRPGMGNSAAWWDFDHDGDIDLHVGNDFLDEDFLFRNNGDGTFTESLKDVFPHSTWFTMGSVITDLNNDGWTDFVVADMFPSTHYKQKASMASMGSFTDVLLAKPGARQIMRNGVFLNSGAGPFREAAYLSGLGQTDWTWAIKSGDYDQDGRQDLFFTNGAARNFNFSDLPSLDHDALVNTSHWDRYENAIGPKMEQNYAFRNAADLQFDDVSADWGLNHVGMTHTSAQGDLDNDGDLDIVTCNLADKDANPNETLLIFRNDGPNGNSIRVKLRGTKSNSMGVGSEVRIKTASGKQVRQLFLCWGFMDSDLAELHFGLGTDPKIDELQVRWPSGIVQTFNNLGVNQTFVITESGESAPPAEPVTPETWFTENEVLAEHGQKETDFDDFSRQSLLPWKLSQFGPPMAWGDVDGDGDDDCYLGGSAGKPGRMLYNKINEGELRFTDWVQKSFKGHEDSEDMGALFFDADADGDLDLYVASGSVEAEAGSALLRDRLYLNNGSGTFSTAQGAIPDIRDSSSSVAAADFDRDGDVDLFVGVRSDIGNYPDAVTSRLLVNQGGIFEDQTEALAPQLIDFGLVTGATWSDFDNDGWVDLVIARDWGPISFFKNNEGSLADHAGPALADNQAGRTGVNDIHGWWNGVAGADIDNDGDIDYVATNFGKNIQYRASVQAPALIFYGDMDGSGRRHIVEAMFENGVCFPWRGLSCSSHAMPFVADKMNNSYHNFAASPISDIYSVDTLKKSTIVKATELRSGWFINDGTGTFEFKPLPHIAQIAPSFGVVLNDFDLDGFVDCYLAQNFWNPQIETAPMMGGLGQLLRRNPDAKPGSNDFFIPIEPFDSGAIVRGDAKSLAVVDINSDQLPDLVVGVNNEAPKVFLNRATATTESLKIRLRGPDGNPVGFGARLKLELDGVPVQVREITAGSGFLSQSSSTQLLARPASTTGTAKLEIRWPDGKVQNYEFPASEPEFVAEKAEPEPPAAVEGGAAEEENGG